MSNLADTIQNKVSDITTNGSVGGAFGFNLNHALGFAMGLPYFPQHPDAVTGLGESEKAEITPGAEYANFDEETSVRIKLHSEPDSEYMVMVPSPIISINGSNIIAKRNVMKTSDQSVRRGSVKERWSTEDYTVTIDGILKSDDDDKYPEEYIRRLVEICEARETVDIQCDLLLPYGITRLSIDTYDFPFTKGLPYQKYTIKGTSDEDFELLIK